MNVQVEAIQWKYHQKKDGTYPVKIRVMWKGEPKYYPVRIEGKSISLSQVEWDELTTAKPKGAKRVLRDAIQHEENRAREIAKQTTLNGRVPFSFYRFEEEYSSMHKHASDFFEIFDQTLSTILKEGRIKTYNSYKNAKVAFLGFLNGVDIQPIDITPTTLKGFENYLLNTRFVSKNTVAIYMRTIRAIYNVAISEQPFLSDFYPFARRPSEKSKYVIRTARGKKGDAFTRSQIELLKNFQLDEGSSLWEAKMLFLFSYYCQGMNFKDIAYLVPKNIGDRSIVYVRRKTRNTEKDEVPIVVPLSERIVEIITALKCNLQDHTQFVFDFIVPSMDLVQQEKAIQQKIKVTNERLKRLCVKLGIPACTTYWARHTAASLLRLDGVSSEIIKDMLGHSDLQTTKTYLRQFDVDLLKAINDKL